MAAPPEHCPGLVPGTLCDLAEQAAERAVIKTLMALGIDASDPIKVQRDFAMIHEMSALALDPEFRKDIEHTRKWRLALQTVQQKGFSAAIGVIVIGFLSALWLGLQQAILHK